MNDPPLAPTPAPAPRAQACPRRPGRRFTRSRRRIIVTLVFIALDIIVAICLWIATSTVQLSE